MRQIVENLIQRANVFDVEGAVSLFSPDSVIDDVSVGDAFVGHEGARLYLERFFVGYKTFSKILSVEKLGDLNAAIRLDFTGDFGHEIGVLKIVANSDGLIERIDADLE